MSEIFNQDSGNEWKTVTPRRKGKKLNSDSPATASSSESINLQSGSSGTPLKSAKKASEKNLLGSAAKILMATGSNGSGNELPRTPLKSSSEKALILDFPGLLRIGKPEGLKSLSVSKLEQIRSEFIGRYPNRNDLQLQAILEHTSLTMDACDISMKPFGSKLFSNEWAGGLFEHLPADKLKWFVKTLSDYSNADLNVFFLTISAVFFEQQKSANPSSILRNNFAHQVFLQLILRHFREKVSLKAALSNAVKNYPHFRANPQIGNSFLWLMAQSQPVTAEDFDIWFEFCLAAFGEHSISSSAVFQILSLEIVEKFMTNSFVPPIEIDAAHVSALLDISHSGSLGGSKKGASFQDRLKLLTQTVSRGIFGSKKKFSVSEVQLFRNLLDLLSKSDVQNNDETVGAVVDVVAATCLRDYAVFKAWSDAIESKAGATRAALKVIELNHSKYSELIGLKQFQDFLTSFASKAAPSKSSSDKVLASKLKVRESSAVWNLVSLLIFLGLLAYVLQHFCEQKLQELQPYCAEYTPVYKKTLVFASEKWAQLSKAVVKLSDDLQLERHFKMLLEKCQEILANLKK